MTPRKRRPMKLWRPPAGEPPLPRMEKKWEGVLNAHAIALGECINRIPKSKRELVAQELFFLARTRGALDYLLNKRTRNAIAYVRAIFQTLNHNKDDVEAYLDGFQEAHKHS